MALLHLSESELRTLHAAISEMSPGTFLKLIGDLEDEISSSMTLTLEKTDERENFGSNVDRLYNQIDQIRRIDLRVSVQHFVDMMGDCLLKLPKGRDVEIPKFSSRRGLEAWINSLVRVFSEQDIFHAAMRVRNERVHSAHVDWKLR